MKASVSLQHIGTPAWKVDVNMYGIYVSADKDFGVSMSEFADTKIDQIHVSRCDNRLEFTIVPKQNGKKWTGIHFLEDLQKKGTFIITKHKYDGGRPVGDLYLSKNGQWVERGERDLPDDAARIPIFE